MSRTSDQHDSPVPRRATDTPEIVLASALDLWDRMEYAAVTALCDPDSIARCFREYCEVVRPPTADDYRLNYPHLSEAEVASWLEGGLREYLRRESQISRAGPGTKDFAELVALAPEVFFQRRLEGDDVRSTFVRRIRERQLPIPDWLFGAERGIRYEILTTESIGATEVRVSYRAVQEHDGRRRDGEIAHELLRRATSGNWRLIARDGVLQSGDSAVLVVPPEFADLFGEDDTTT
jgi:hypothetical protein